MQTEIKDNGIRQIDDPPVPPPAHFNEHDMAQARPVQPLLRTRTRRLLNRGKRFAGVAAVLPVILVAFSISFALATALMNWSASPPADKSDNEPVSQSLAATGDEEMDSADKSTVEIGRPQKRRGHSSRHLERIRARPIFDSDDEDDNGRPRARLVSVIH